ncbi:MULTISPECIES: FliM/FliN family flagellar motor C-terminal domain-containing protein [unclassified Yoonia]|uniref:FliM/FliN family flagellar motor C-terminal domain-containing protein n=1 Tax=unclassified Yoonia TaxID=2629118 RepID=UPI002AFFD6FC|nr:MULTISPECIES: FliM/FliN family flagellar motor C-terminal domain-containing protein [unclassified Yoonia]
MTQSSHISILRRMAGQAGDAAPATPLTTSRAMRLALVKAANDAVGLALDVVSIGEDSGRLDDLLAQLDAGLMLVGLHRHGTLAGFVALDMQLRAAIVEMQTMGRLNDQAADNRPATGTDKALCDPLLAAFLASLPAAVSGTRFEDWVDDLAPGDRLADSRVAGLQLRDGDYRLLHMNVGLGADDRQGAVLLALPLLAQPADPVMPVTTSADWHTAFAAVVQDAPASLTARLHRFTLPLGQAQALKVGQVLPLPGCSVTSVRLIAADGRSVARVKLGQMGGKRAVRITLEQIEKMHDLVVDTGGDVPLALPSDLRLPNEVPDGG